MMKYLGNLLQKISVFWKESYCVWSKICILGLVNKIYFRLVMIFDIFSSHCSVLKMYVI